MEVDPSGAGAASVRSPAPAASSGGSGSGASSDATSRRGEGVSGAARIAGLQDDSNSSDDESGQAFYAGGSSTSGQQILGPSKKKKGAELVKEMFRMARDAGAEAVESAGPSGGTRGGANSRAFQGTAFKLGSDNSDSQVLPGKTQPLNSYMLQKAQLATPERA